MSQLGVVEGPKWIEFRLLLRREGLKTDTWAVMPKREGGTELGIVKWYGPWRKYSFFPAPQTVYEPTCLRDIADFCEQETRKRKAAR